MLSPQKVFLHVLRELFLMLLQCSMLGMLSPQKVFFAWFKGFVFNVVTMGHGLSCFQWGMAWLGFSECISNPL